MTDWIWFLIGFSCSVIPLSRICLHYYQLESYQFPGFWHTVTRQWKRTWLPAFLLTLWALGVYAIYGLIAEQPLAWLYGILSIIASVGVSFLITRLFLPKKEKKPFAMTARMKRLYAVLAVTMGLVTLLCALCVPVSGFHVFIPLLTPVWVLLAGVLALPIEKLIFEMYFRDAQKKLLADPRLIRIGITGSYGKTSVKFILNTILSQKYNVLATPASYNTPMGVTRIVRERLNAGHQVFLGEMGARHVGDIKEMCRLVHPTIGVITSVGPQHLETFKTIDRIANTKNELMEALPEDGIGIFSDDKAIVTGLYEKMQKKKLIVGCAGDDVYAENISVSGEGSLFDVCFAGGERFSCTTRLLGAHNIRNILLSCAVAKQLGLTNKQMQHGIEALQPIEHRLQLLKTAGGVSVIDDAFNSNPSGAKAALDVLKVFKGRRIIVTPGMVELGDKEAEYNHAFGEQMAQCVDMAFLVGMKHTEPIKKGLIEKGFDKAKIFSVKSLSEAVERLNKMMQQGDVILYENDLPDNYSEN